MSRLEALRAAAQKVRTPSAPSAASLGRAKHALAMTLSRLKGRLMVEPMTIAELAREYEKTISMFSLDLSPIPAGPLSGICVMENVTVIHHEGRDCISWSKNTKAFVESALTGGATEAVEPEIIEAEQAQAEPCPPMADAAAEEGPEPSDSGWKPFIRDRRRSDDDTAHVRKGCIIITPRAAASVGFWLGGHVRLYSRDGQVKVETCEGGDKDALKLTGDGNNTGSVKISAHAFVREHDPAIGRYRLERVRDGVAILTLVEAAQSAV